MWNLQSIEATNLCAFEHFKYKITQNQATLIFGNNMDNDSQNSNGSGKSALIEAIAIALTGETLRKVNMDEIINDKYDECCIEAFLKNEEQGVDMRITRIIPRKGTQTIKIVRGEAGDDEEVKEATIADYNKYILDTLGLSKDDIYSNFILTAKKYKSFLSSSDREKKEIINRFSNGVLVDESIEALHKDMEPVQQQFAEAEKVVAENTGKVAAIENEIEKAIADSNDRSASRKERIENWKQAITDKRAYIREQNEAIKEEEADIEACNDIDVVLQKLEKSKKSFKEKYETIISHLKLETDYSQKIDELQQQIEKYEADEKASLKSHKQAADSLKKAESALEKAKALHTAQSDENDQKSISVGERINSLTKEVRDIQMKENELQTKRKDIQERIAFISKCLAGTIACPKCKHEFVLNQDVNVAEFRKEKEQKETEQAQVLQQIEDTQKQYEDCVADGRKARAEVAALAEARLQIDNALRDVEREVSKARNSEQAASEDMVHAQQSLERAQKQLDNLHKDMFDDAFDTLDKDIAQDEANIKQLELNISNAEGAIKSYEESIKEAENAAETDIISSLKESRTKYQNALQQSILNKEEIERQYNEFKVQEANFIEFKTYLANIKIDAISEITNNFLESIGSDIRVKLSGYTLLKSGKVRDKISVSLIRDGIDCGSFEKFSKGEQTRVELANILALHKLTNVNCESGKGLNLLVFDEILDATDEQGLSNVFKAINDTQITSLVVSHGNVAENYPNRLIINKHNGISFID